MGIKVPVKQGAACFNVEEMEKNNKFLAKAELMREKHEYLDVIERDSLWRTIITAESTRESRWIHDFSKTSSEKMLQTAKTVLARKSKAALYNYYDEEKIRIVENNDKLRFIYFQEEVPVGGGGAVDDQGRSLSTIPNFQENLYLTNVYCFTIYNGKEIWFVSTPVDYGDVTAERDEELIKRVSETRKTIEQPRQFFAALVQDRYFQIVCALLFLVWLIILNGKAKREALKKLNNSNPQDTEGNETAKE